MINDFTPKYIKMASKYLQESLDNLNKKNEVKILPLEKKESLLKNIMQWVFKN